MKQHYLQMMIVAALAIVAMAGNAAPVDVAAARDKASRVLVSQSQRKLMKVNTEVNLAHTEVSSVDADLADYYVFNSVDGGAFVIVAGDDRAPEVLAWGNGALDVAQVPCNVKWLLGQYKRQMECLRSHAAEKAAPKPSPRRAPDASLTVEPLLTCTWSQLAPYYDQCPTYEGQLCVTGCIATAMAQVMYFWKYPDELPPLPAYVTSTLQFDVPALPGTRLDWDNMLDHYGWSYTYTQEQGAAVATLMRYCGQASFMDYSPEGSGAHQIDQLAGLFNFGYSPEALYVYRDDFGSEEWESMLLDDLKASRPVLYVGYNQEGGHAFVIDGCADGKYHVNWGSGGSYDGYFTLDMLGTGDWAYNYYQAMLYGVYPDASGSSVVTYDFEADGIYYKENGDGVEVVNKDYHYNSYQGTVSIPPTVAHDGKTCQVTAIGNNAFRGCTGLTRVDIPSTVRAVGENAFRNCVNISEITIGENIEFIGANAFYECLKLERVNIKDVASYCNIELETMLSSPFYSGARMYCDGQEVKDLVIPGSVKDIEVCAFFFCPSFESVTICEGVTHIGEYAFMECPSLKSLTLPASMEMVDYAAFSYCEALEEINFMGDNLPMDYFVFYGCTSLKHVEMPAGQQEIPYCTFGYCSALESIDLGLSLKKIDLYAFYQCNRLETLTLPETLNYIAGDAFTGCTGLKSVNAASLKAWCGIQFENVDANPVSLSGHLSIDGQPLEQLVVPEGVTDITNYLFYNCQDLTSATVSDGVTSIGELAFSQCTNLESINLSENVNVINDKAFKGCTGLKSVNAASLESWCGIDFKSETANPVSQSRHLSIDGQPLQQLVVPEGITSIKAHAFSGCDDLTSVTVPRGVTSIGDYAFYKCEKLETVSLGNDVKTIGEKSFNICSSLKSVSLGSAVESIGNRAFASCLVLTDITCGAVTPPEVTGSACFSSGVFKKATLRVLARSQVAYRNASVWGQFNTIRVICNTAAADVNRDGEVNIADVNTLIDAILCVDDTRQEIDVLDVNGDGEVSVADVNFVLSVVVYGN